jgi:uncharacterized membrane protein
MDRLRLVWDAVRTSLWFVPLLMGLAAVALASALLGVRVAGEGREDAWLLHTGSQENARELMSALLTGMISMTALVVSITMVVLTLAAGQIGPRLIRSFIRDRTTQAVLGLFLADILYLLTVFRSIDAVGAGVPHLAVSVGTAATALCLLVLLVYVHKLARSIVYDTVVENVAREVHRSVREMLPAGPEPEEPAPELPGEPAWVRLDRDGYVQAVAFGDVVAAARTAGAAVRLHFRPGDFVLAAGEHAAVHPASRATAGLREAVRAAVVVGSERTPAQDVEFGVRQLVEVSTRALSPGLNDVFTALAVVDNLSAILSWTLPRGTERRVLRDGDGEVRVVRDVVGHADLIAAALDPVRQSGQANAAVLSRLARAVGRLGPAVRTAEQREALEEQLDMLVVAADRNLAVPRDVRSVRAEAAAARRRLAACAARP